MKLEDVKVGMWVADANGVYQVMEEYDYYHNWYVCKEVLNLDEDGNYELEDDYTYITKNEMKKCEYYGEGE